MVYTSLALYVATGLLSAQPAAALSMSTLPKKMTEGAKQEQGALDGGAGSGGVPARWRPALLHFMFELRDYFPHPEVWGAFWAAAPAGSHMVWAHCTDQFACENDYTMTLLNIRVVKTTFSKRGADLVNPFVQMIKTALPATEHLAAAGVMEKFIVISDSTWPVKPFSFVYRTLATTTASDFCIATVNQWAYRNLDGVPLKLVKHHQWVTLNRSDAATLAREWTPVHFIKDWQVPLKSPTWAGQNRSVSRLSFWGGTWYSATDEEAVYATLFGPMELPKAGDNRGPQRLFDERRCDTYVSFPHDLNPVDDPSFPAKPPPPGTAFLQLGADAQASHSQLLAAARFDATVITTQLLQDPASKLVVPPGVWHPYVIEELGDPSLAVLLRSPYLFARKFSPSAHIVNYSRVMFK